MGLGVGICMTLLMVLGIFMMLIILLQRGRGGGLAGAFGGLGGQSAFGTKAGDVFTKITIGMAVAWTILAGVSGILLRANPTQKYSFEENLEDADPKIPKSPAIEPEQATGDATSPAKETTGNKTSSEKARGDDPDQNTEPETQESDSNKNASSDEGPEGTPAKSQPTESNDNGK